MGVHWEKYHVGVYPQHATLFIGKGEENPKTGQIVYAKDRSNNRTDEILEKVAEMMFLRMQKANKKNNDDLPFYEYHLPQFGKLVFIPNGYDCFIKPAPRNKNRES